MTNGRKTVCYRCDRIATTREHFPPKSFFPKGTNLQLQTVRSCELHNNSKSNDDQYLLAHICLNASRGENLAKQVFLRSIVPLLDRSPAFQKMINEGAEWLPDGSRRYPVDVARFNNFFDSLSCAVFFDRFSRQFDSNTHILHHVYLSLTSEDLVDNQQVELASNMMEYFFRHHRALIEHFEADHINEVVYSNDILAPGGVDASITIAHSFYGVFEVVSLMTRKPPANLLERDGA